MMTALEVAESLKEIIKAQSEIIYDMALEMEHSRDTGGFIADNVSMRIKKAAKALQEASENL
ncbi:hypothetical protein E5329_18715 [Petralouisia muris]|uniref:Uncharacterized protein n=1 Tax=Petralouisia muris TaxID=3032872 RepID=A0AC61RSG4_9FIRM|nr:hypothetical protein [Petralouisia muris]TGY93451.1 hypothetical protein E5329_18715 [Petralouisia muris]